MNATEKYRKTKKGILTNSYSHQKKRKPVCYTLNELHNAFLEDKKFNRLYNEWVKSGFVKGKKPTIDRINCKEGYLLNNIHCMSWEDNRYKQRMECNIFRAKPIGKYKEGVLIESFKSVSDAVRKTGIMQGNISSCLTGKRNKCGGYQWKYINPPNPELIKE